MIRWKILVLFLTAAALVMGGSIVDPLICSAAPETISGSITSITGVNVPLQPGDHFSRSQGDRDIASVIAGIIAGLIMVVIGIAYHIGYNRFGGEEVIVERDDRLGEG